MISPDRKLIEKEVFNTLYNTESDNVSPIVRKKILRDSEINFEELIQRFSPNKNVLEIGCGAARHSFLALKYGANKVSAIDISEVGIKLARKNAETLGLGNVIDFHVMDVETMLFSDETFDVIINHEVFSSIDFDVSIKELQRVLKPGGVIICKETFGHNPLFNLKRRLNVALNKRTSWCAQHIFDKTDLRKAEQYFRVSEVSYFHIVKPLIIPFTGLMSRDGDNFFVSTADKIDKYLLRFNFLKNLAFKIVLILQKK